MLRPSLLDRTPQALAITLARRILAALGYQEKPMIERIPVTKVSMFTGKIHTAYLPVTREQLARISDGENIGTVLADIPPEWREFIKTGVTPAEWKREFGRVRSADYDGPEIAPVQLVEVPRKAPRRG